LGASSVCNLVSVGSALFIAAIMIAIGHVWNRAGRPRK
jgi:hypothetical protein